MSISISNGITMATRRAGGDAIASALATRAGIDWRPWQLSTLFTDTAGTVPATAPGDIIAVQKSLSKTGLQFQQTTLANRPVLVRHPKRGRVNALVGTAIMGTQSVTTTAAQRTLSFTGTGTVTLTGTSTAGPLVGTGVSDRVSLTFTPTAGTLTLTVSGSVTDAQLQLGAAFDSLQTVNATGTSITEPGQSECWGLQGDGFNDGMATAATIDMSGSDRIAAFLGCFRNGTNTFQSGIEFGPLAARWDTVSGAFNLFTTGSLTTNLLFDSRGTSGVGPNVTGQPAPPDYCVLTLLSHISGPRLIGRRNASQILSIATTQGTGNFGNHTVTILDTQGGNPSAGIDWGGAVISGLDATTDAALIAAIEKQIAANVPGVVI